MLFEGMKHGATSPVKPQKVRPSPFASSQTGSVAEHDHERRL